MAWETPSDDDTKYERYMIAHAFTPDSPNNTMIEEQQTTSLHVSGEQHPESGTSMEKLWAEAAKEFERICGKSLRRGEIKDFDDVQRRIEGACKGGYGVGDADRKWEKAKDGGLEWLGYLKMLVGVASKASSLVPIPAAAADISSSALCFVFDIPKAIKGYNNAVDQVFSEASSALVQLQTYKSLDDSQVDARLLKQIQLVMISFVKICAHVVKYRQGRWKNRFLRQAKSVFNDDSGLTSTMDEFKRALHQLHNIEGTLTAIGVQDVRKGLQTINDKYDRTAALTKIRDTLGLQNTELSTKPIQTCIEGTGAWIWTHDAYRAWTTSQDTDPSVPRPHILFLSGSESSGKTSASALVTKRLEDEGGRVYTAHYFFSTTAGNKRTDGGENVVALALKSMALQIAQVDSTARNALHKACSTPNAFRRSASTSLDALWSELKIGVSGSSATYYLVFDGIESLSTGQAKKLLEFILGLESRRPVRVLASGTTQLFEDLFNDGLNRNPALHIQMNDCNGPDIRLFIDRELAKHRFTDSDVNPKWQRIREKIVDTLPQKVKGNYSLLQISLDNVVRLLSTRSTAEELDRVLAQPTNNHETVIKALQDSLTEAEIDELNELLKWVLFSNVDMTLNQLEAVMFLCSRKESLTSLQSIISTKYSAVLQIGDGNVYGQDGVEEYFKNQKHPKHSKASPYAPDPPTISMTISIKNAGQEHCSRFLWDLAEKCVMEKFDFDKAIMSSRTRGVAVIAVDEFEAHHTIVKRTFDYLGSKASDQTEAVGNLLVTWLPYHLGRLRGLEDNGKGDLTPYDKFRIGDGLFMLFQNDSVLIRHRASFERTWWFADEMQTIHKWLMDPVVVRNLGEWRDRIQMTTSWTNGYLEAWAKTIVEGVLRSRNWDIRNGYSWIAEFMKADKEFYNPPVTSSDISADTSLSTSPAETTTEIDWNSVSTWCQAFLGLQESQLDSLWYERLAEASSLLNSQPDITISFWQRAIEKDGRNWRCYYNLGKLLYDQGRTQESITQTELGLREAERCDAVPQPETKDIVDFHVLLWQSGGGDVQDRLKYYLAACESQDGEQARQGRLGYLITSLRSDFSGVEMLRQSLKLALAWDNGRDIVTILKILACEPFHVHNVLIWRLCAVAMSDSCLLDGVLRVMNTVTGDSIIEEPAAADSLPVDTCSFEDESRGVLLYYRGLMAYILDCKVSSSSSDPTSEALRLWDQSLLLLSNVARPSSMPNAEVVQQHVRIALAKHYFQTARDGQHEDDPSIDKLNELIKDVDDPTVGRFLCNLYVLQEKRQLARNVFREKMKEALQILSDETPDNDVFGFLAIKYISEAYQDFRNMAVALSLLGQPDLVTGALYFEEEEIGEGLDKKRVMDSIADLAKQMVQAVDQKFPSTSQQVQRINVAKDIASILETGVSLETNSDSDDPQSSEKYANENVSIIVDLARTPAPEIEAAHRLILGRISELHEIHQPEINRNVFQTVWFCCGRTPDGKHCPAEADFEQKFYHCIFCLYRGFCGTCLERLRNPTESSISITECSAKHCWLEAPPFGDRMYVGSRAKSVRLPQEVKPMEEDPQILQIIYAEDGSGEEITVEEWKDELAKEWEIEI